MALDIRHLNLPLLGFEADPIGIWNLVCPHRRHSGRVHVKDAAPLGESNLALAAIDTWHRGLADGLILSGAQTGSTTDRDHLRIVREACPRAPILVGSGVTPETAPDLLRYADALIVGSALEMDGLLANPVGVDRVRIVASVLN
ncbi:MAG: BtpA/SgcQ family protein [Verrucomicrobiota bacterium]